MTKRLMTAENEFKNDGQILTVISELENAKESLNNVDKIWLEAEENDEILESKIAENFPFDNMSLQTVIYNLDVWINKLKK